MSQVGRETRVEEGSSGGPPMLDGGLPWEYLINAGVMVRDREGTPKLHPCAEFTVAHYWGKELLHRKRQETVNGTESPPGAVMVGPGPPGEHHGGEHHDMKGGPGSSSGKDRPRGLNQAKTPPRVAHGPEEPPSGVRPKTPKAASDPGRKKRKKSNSSSRSSDSSRSQGARSQAGSQSSESSSTSGNGSGSRSDSSSGTSSDSAPPPRGRPNLGFGNREVQYGRRAQLLDLVFGHLANGKDHMTHTDARPLARFRVDANTYGSGPIPWPDYYQTVARMTQSRYSMALDLPSWYRAASGVRTFNLGATLQQLEDLEKELRENRMRVLRMGMCKGQGPALKPRAPGNPRLPVLLKPAPGKGPAAASPVADGRPERARDESDAPRDDSCRRLTAGPLGPARYRVAVRPPDGRR